MQFAIQHNLINPGSLEDLKNAMVDNNIPYEFVGVIPFSHEITGDLSGAPDLIPYGSTLLTTLALEQKWTGLHFDPKLFNYTAAAKNRDDMLNAQHVLELKDAIDFMRQNSGRNWFVRPSDDLKQFSGQVIAADEAAAWFEDMMLCETSGTYKLEANTHIVIAEPQDIQAEFRWFIVDGEPVDGSMYRAHGQLRKEHVTDTRMIREARWFAGGWMPDTCCVMDLALVNNELKVIEFNCINSSGFYDNDVSKIMLALWNYHRP